MTFAKKGIRIEAPKKMPDDEHVLNELIQTLQEASNKNILVKIRKSSEAILPEEILELETYSGYVTNPVTIIDNSIIWFGQPLAANDFKSEGESIKTEYFPAVRFCGTQTVKSMQSILRIR